eukprot:scaffold5931_cov410-Prasinococcus_capsulatus_cf.AAC.7
MDFSVGRKSVPVVSAPSTTTRGAHATQILNLYNNPPKEEISMEEFERYALDRLRVLKGLDDARSRGKKPEEVNEICKKLIGDNLTGTSQQDTRRKDELSHFVLRLAYCRTEELRRWFLTQESILLRMRFNNAYSDHQLDFLADLGLEYKPISKDEFMRVFDKVRDVMRVTDPTGKTGILTEDDSSRFYKVPFEEVPELVASRRVYLSKGFAYVPRDQLSSLVVGHFRSKLSKALVLTSRKWSSYGLAEENDRLAPIVSALSNRYLGPDYSQPDAVGEAISLKELPALASRSFPLCMKNLYDKLREDHHLRHFGRMQLGLFLKGIGLTMEDALMFWKAEFTKKIPADKFEKEYAYNIRHNYGKEGKRQDYTPYTCMKVISSTPGAGDSHGCPYRHFSKVRALANKLCVRGRIPCSPGDAELSSLHLTGESSLGSSRFTPEPEPD